MGVEIISVGSTHTYRTMSSPLPVLLALDVWVVVIVLSLYPGKDVALARHRHRSAVDMGLGGETRTVVPAFDPSSRCRERVSMDRLAPRNQKDFPIQRYLDTYEAAGNSSHVYLMPLGPVPGAFGISS